MRFSFIMTVKPYNRSTASDFQRLFCDRFDSGVSSLQCVLANPLLRQIDRTGDIAYDQGGEVLAIFGLVPRRVYWRQIPLLAGAAFAMARRKGPPLDFLTQFLREAICTHGMDIFLANTVIPPSRKRLQEAVEAVDGPDACAYLMERQFHPLTCRFRKRLKRWFGRNTEGAYFEKDDSEFFPVKVSATVRIVRCHEIDAEKVDRFWRGYLDANRGLVSSRSAEELDWMFGRDISQDRAVMLVAMMNEKMVGYIICSRVGETVDCWRIGDMLAIGNDEHIIDQLVMTARKYLCKVRAAEYFQVTGFPDWIQPVLRRHFPRRHFYGWNKCIWQALNAASGSLCGDWTKDRDCWFGCPYDGDMCLI